MRTRLCAFAVHQHTARVPIPASTRLVIGGKEIHFDPKPLAFRSRCSACKSAWPALTKISAALLPLSTSEKRSPHDDPKWFPFALTHSNETLSKSAAFFFISPSPVPFLFHIGDVPQQCKQNPMQNNIKEKGADDACMRKADPDDPHPLYIDQYCLYRVQHPFISHKVSLYAITRSTMSVCALCITRESFGNLELYGKIGQSAKSVECGNTRGAQQYGARVCALFTERNPSSSWCSDAFSSSFFHGRFDASQAVSSRFRASWCCHLLVE